MNIDTTSLIRDMGMNAGLLCFLAALYSIGAATVVALDHGAPVWADRHPHHARAAAAG